MELVETIAANLRRIRAQRGMTQDQLAAAIGSHRSYVSSIELGLRNLTLRSVDKLAGQLGVHRHELLDETLLEVGPAPRQRVRTLGQR